MALSYLQRFQCQPAFPTERHGTAAEAVVDYFAPNPRVQAVLLTGSCARGRASPLSCVDILILVAPQDLPRFQGEERIALEAFLSAHSACVALAQAVPWSGVDASFSSGEFSPGPHSWTSGPDHYEVEIGNTLAWTHPMLARGSRFEALQREYLPYYDEAQRRGRLSEVVRFAANNLDHVEPYAERSLFVQALKRLHHAFEEYLQALFIHRRIYPIAYDKWIHEQIAEILNDPALYRELLSILALPTFAVRHFRDRAQRLRSLLTQLE